MPALNLAIAFSTLGVSGAVRGIGSVQSGLQGLSGSAGRSGALLTGVVTAPLIAGFLTAAGAVATYEQNLNILAATAGLTASQQAEAGRVAKQLGADITIPGANAGDAAAAMVELGKAGLGFTDIIGAAPGVLRLAAAGELAVADAARIAANALNSFNLPGSQATRVADVLAAAANASSADVSGLALAFQQGSAAASFAKVPIEEFAATLGLMANRGIQASDAGTSFKTFMASLGKNTKPAIAAQKLLGISFFDTAGKMKALPVIAEDLRRSLSKLTDIQKSQVIDKIFGSDAGRLARVFGSLDAGEFTAMIAAVGKQGAAADLAGARMKGLSGAIEILKNAWDTLVITTLEPFLPVMTAAVGAVTTIVGAFADLDPNVRNAALAFAAVLVSAGPVLLLVSGLAGALAFLLTPFGLVTGVLAVMAGRWALNGGRLEDFLPKLEAFGIILRNVMQGKDSVRLLELAFQNLTGIDVSGWFEGIASVFTFTRDAVLTFIGALSGNWAGDAASGINPVHLAIGNIGRFIREVALPALISFGQWFLTVGVPALQRFGNFVITTVIPVLAQLGGWIIANVLPPLQRFGEWFINEGLPALQRFGTFVANDVLPQVQSLGNWLATTGLKAVQDFGKWFASDGVPLLNSFKGAAEAIGNTIVDLVGPAFLVLKGNAGEILTSLGPLITAFKDLLVAIEPISKAIGLAFGAAAALIPSMIRQLTGFVQVISGTFSLIGALVSGIVNAFTALASGDTKGALDAITKAWGDFGKAGDLVGKGFGNIAGSAGDAANALGPNGPLAGLFPGATVPATIAGGGSRGFGSDILPGAPGSATERPPLPIGPPAPTPEELERAQRKRDADERLISKTNEIADAYQRTMDVLDGIPTEWGSRFAAAMEAR